MITVVQDNDIYKIHFHYDANIVELVKEVPGRRFDGANKYWTIPKDRLGFLLDKFKGTPYEHLVDVYNNENISENATLDATTNIPDINISDVNHYVEDGSQLFPHQLDFLKYAIDKQNHDDFSGFILADQMGLGKSIEFINLALYNRERYGIKHCLIIVCLNSAKYNWASEITKHTNGQETPYILGSRIKRDGTINTDTSSADKLKDLMTGRMYGKEKGELLPFFIIMNIEAIRFKQQRHFAIREQLSLLCNNDYIGMIAVDEIHRNASAQSQNGRQLLELKKSLRVPVEWIPMTGTPIVNKPTDVYVPLKLVDGHHFTSFYKWQQNFCVFGGFGDHEVLTYKNIPELKEWLQGKMLRRLKKDVLDLPEKLHTIEYVDNTPYQMQLYRTIVVDMLAHSEEIKASSNPAVKFLRLRQVNGCPELVDTELKVNKDYLAKNAKLQRLLELVVSIVENGEKVVIFSNWVETLRTIYRFLASRYKVCVFTGTMKQQDREAHKQKFINDSNYMILMGTTEALGVSHTLTVAHNVIFYDEPWNYAKFEQAEDRCHRAGTTSTVNVYSLITRDTVDDKVHNMIMTKDGISKYIVDGQLDFKNNPQLVEILLGKSK